MSEAVSVTKPKGRGKDLKPRKKRTDCSVNVSMPPDDKMKILAHNLELMQLGRVDKTSPEAIRERTRLYFEICSKNIMLPTVAGFALALGIDRRTLWDWITNGQGAIKNPAVIDALKETYALINSQYEDMLNNGEINPVSAFFLLKNNHGYKDQTDHVITARQDQPETESELLERAELLGEGSIE